MLLPILCGVSINTLARHSTHYACDLVYPSKGTAILLHNAYTSAVMLCKTFCGFSCSTEAVCFNWTVEWRDESLMVGLGSNMPSNVDGSLLHDMHDP